MQGAIIGIGLLGFSGLGCFRRLRSLGLLRLFGLKGFVLGVWVLEFRASHSILRLVYTKAKPTAGATCQVRLPKLWRLFDSAWSFWVNFPSNRCRP